MSLKDLLTNFLTELSFKESQNNAKSQTHLVELAGHRLCEGGDKAHYNEFPVENGVMRLHQKKRALHGLCHKFFHVLVVQDMHKPLSQARSEPLN